MFTTILDASDGSDTADHLVAVAQSLAARDRAKVVVAHVNELMVMRGGAQPVHLDEDVLQRKVRLQLADPARTVPSPGRPITQLTSTRR